jgi:hypothetical protein
MNRNVFPENAPSLRFHVLSFPCLTVHHIFDFGRQARPGRQLGIRLYWRVPAEGQNKSWEHMLTAKAIHLREDI